MKNATKIAKATIAQLVERSTAPTPSAATVLANDSLPNNNRSQRPGAGNLTLLFYDTANDRIGRLHESIRHPGAYETAVFAGCILVLLCFLCCRCAAERPKREREYVTLPLITIKTGSRR